MVEFYAQYFHETRVVLFSGPSGNKAMVITTLTMTAYRD